MRKTYILARNSTKKFLPPELAFMIQICTKSFVGWGFAPDPTGRAYSAPPDPLTVFRGLHLMEGRAWVGQRRGREKNGKAREGREGREGRGPMTLGHGLQCLNPAQGMAPFQPTNASWWTS